MFTVHRSNRMAELERALCEVVRAAPLPPLAPEVIVVPSRGIERWLALSLADSLGVWANSRFPFPRAFVDEVMCAVLGEDDRGDRFTRESLRWAIASLLPGLVEDPELADVARYLESGEEQKLFGFADRIAYTFDQYAVFRPDLARDWEIGKGRGWQPVLWRALVERLGEAHFGARLARFQKRFAELGALPAGIPARLNVFGISALPPAYLELFALLATRIEVHAYLLAPSARVVADVRERAPAFTRSSKSERGIPRLADFEPDADSLVRSMARVAWETELVLACIDATVSDDRWVAPPTDTMLGTLVSDVLGLEQRSEQRLLLRTDQSIAVHACHGPMRELEVLRDQLRAALEADPGLEPHDIVVLLSDVERYAPFVDAVFGVDPASTEHVPYRIADRSRRATSIVADALLALLDVLGSRFGVSQVLDLLKLPPIRDRAGLSPEEIMRIEDWLLDVGVRWGIDAAHRKEEGQPAHDEGTWRFGLDRLLLGFALPGGNRLLYEDTLPYDRIEGQEALAAGKLAELVEKLVAFRGRFAAPLTPLEWQTALGELLTSFLSVPEHSNWQLSSLREAIEAFVASAERAGFAQPIGRAAFAQLLGETLEQERLAHAFLSGGVTFCALTPMRSIPFRVVCLVGMNDGAFPRQRSAPAFDEMEREPRVGDRATRDEDRLAFLEALLSASERVIITYVGRGLKDDAELPPSVVVGELLDALDARFAWEDAPPPPPAKRSKRTPPEEQLALFSGLTLVPPPRTTEKASARIRVAHPLQAFSVKYFDEARKDARLFSYGQLELGGARALLAEPSVQAPLFPTPLGIEPLARVDLDELVAFFDHPARFLLERRAAVDLREKHKVLDEREPVEPDALEQHIIGQSVLERVLQGFDQERAYALTHASGRLASGTPGRVRFDEYWAKASALGRIILGERGDGPPERMEVSIPIGDRRVEGLVDRIWPRARVSFAYSARPARVELELWIRHLALSASARASTSVLVRRTGEGAKVEIVRIPPLAPADATEELARLLTIFDIGQRQPLCFFPRSARAFAQRMVEEDDVEKALRAAETEFTGGRELAEWSDPYFSRLFLGSEALGPDYAKPSFPQLAAGVYVPFLQRAERETLS